MLYNDCMFIYNILNNSEAYKGDVT
jgi:hypothetical protein